MSQRPPRGSDRDGEAGEAGTASDSPPTAGAGGRGWLLVVGLLAVPMAIVPVDGDLTIVSLWGFFNTAALDSRAGVGGYPVWAYFLDQPRAFGSLPPSIRAWPLAIGFHLLAVASAVGGVAIGREDRRVTGGLLALAAAASLWVSVGLATRLGVGTTAGWLAVIPVGALATLAVVVAAYRADLRGIVER